MFTARMSDTGESITGGTDMLSGILSIVYACEYESVVIATEFADSGWPTDVKPVDTEDTKHAYHWTITKAK